MQIFVLHRTPTFVPERCFLFHIAAPTRIVAAEKALKQVLDCRSGSQGRSRSRSATKSRAVFFCLGFSKFWKTPIHVLLRRRNKHNLLWLRVSMSYHRFNNLRELFQGHLNEVLLRYVVSEDLRDRPCNCPGRGSCRYNNVCRKALIVYKVGSSITLVQRLRRWCGLGPASGCRVPALDVGPKK
jgi:hypothetical protein